MLDWLACTLVRFLTGLLCLLPPGLAVWLGEQFGVLVYLCQPKRGRIGRLNLRAAFPGMFSPAQTQRIIRDCYKQLGGGFAELLRLPVIDRAYIDRYVTVEGRSEFEHAVTSDRPAIFLTGTTVIGNSPPSPRPSSAIPSSHSPGRRTNFPDSTSSWSRTVNRRAAGSSPKAER